MTSGGYSAAKPKSSTSLQSAKKLHFNVADHRPDESWSEAAATRFSAWTPVTNKPSNHQERTTLLLHWFDLWTDQQRKDFLHLVLRRCSKSQLKFISAYFMEAVPVSQVDFTTVLPRFLSLFILSFLSPMDLCVVAQVSWYWRFLSEQDCLWSPKCVRRGWFLPYSPANNEFGAWKKHYIACAASLDFLSPREAAGIYGTMNEVLTETEEQEERHTEHMIRNTIRRKIAQHKGAALQSRRAWLTNSLSGGTYISCVQQKSSTPPLSLTTALVQLGDKCRLDTSLRSNECYAQLNSTLNSTYKNTRGTSTGTLPVSFPSKLTVNCITESPVHLLLVSSRVPAYELVLCGARSSVVPLLYDYSGMTLETLLPLARRAVQGRAVQSVGIMAEGSAEEIHLIEGLRISEKTVLKPYVRAFWEEMCGWVVPASEAGSLDFFLPLAASAAGRKLLGTLSALSGLSVRAPTGICTGSYQHILSEWSSLGNFPPLLYLREGPLLTWCRQAEWMDQALGALRSQLGPHLPLWSQEAWGRALGLFLWDHINLPVITINSEVTQVLIEGLVAVIHEIPENPLEFLANFLLSKCAEVGMTKSDQMPVSESYRLHTSIPQGLLSDADWRSAICKELLRSERAHVRLLQAVHTVYYSPLRAALDSNRAIISSANLLLLFSPLLDILETNKVFLQALTERLEDWSPLQCVGDVCVRLCTKLPAYTNFFNNYPSAIRTIDKCREMLPVFRAFLKRHNRTLATRMLSLQELFLSPFLRVEEYVTLLQALMLYTPAEHPDHKHVSSALNTLLNYRVFINKLKKYSNQDVKLVEAQRSIQGCPNLQEDGRYLIMKQDVSLLSCLNEDIAPPFRYYSFSVQIRIYECVSELGLFLFNDALVLTERKEWNVPFTLAADVSYVFLASVALHSLRLSEIVDTKYVQNAFCLESPKRRWICVTHREDDKLKCLGALRSAVRAATNN